MRSDSEIEQYLPAEQNEEETVCSLSDFCIQPEMMTKNNTCETRPDEPPKLTVKEPSFLERRQQHAEEVARELIANSYFDEQSRHILNNEVSFGRGKRFIEMINEKLKSEGSSLSLTHSESFESDLHQPGPKAFPMLKQKIHLELHDGARVKGSHDVFVAPAC